MSDAQSWAITPEFDPVFPDELEEYERSIGLLLPEDYRQFLLAHNGGILCPDQLDIPDTDHAVIVDFLYGVSKTRIPGDLAYELEQHRGDLPEGFLPIGHDPGGSPFLLATSGEHRGRVFFWDRTWFFKDSSATGNTYWLADNFPALLDSLYEAEE
jgi:hypothetical protein